MATVAENINSVVNNEKQFYVITNSMPANGTASGSIDANAETVVITPPNGCSTVSVQITGTWVGQLEFEGTVDGTNYASVEASNGSSTINATQGNDIFILPGASYVNIRVRASAWTSGTAVITFIGSIGATTSIMTGSLPAGTNSIGTVATSGTTITQTPTVTAGAYSAGDNVGGLLTFANAALVTGGGGVIKNVMIIDDAGQDVELELWLFDTTFTAGSDNDAWAPTEAELHTLITVISTEDSAQGYIAGGTPSICDIEVARRYDCTGTSLFGRLVTRGEPTYVATDDVTVRIGLLID